MFVGQRLDWDDFARAMAQVAGDLSAQTSLSGTLDRVVHHVVDLVEGCEVAAVVDVRDRRIRTLAATGDLPRKSSRLQAELGEGPCFDAAHERREVYRIGKMSAASDRWPRFALEAWYRGIGSKMGFVLFTEDRAFGALNLYSSGLDAFTERSEHYGWIFATHAAVAVASAHETHGLREAVATRQEIGEAVGIVMERHKLTEGQAFDLLRISAQHRTIKVRDIARCIIETGEVPGSPVA